MSEAIQLNTGSTIPLIGFGTWQLHMRDARAATAEAIQAGYRLIDTARIYHNERQVGMAVRESGVQRENLFVTTKLWNSHHGYDRALKAFSSSLKRLGLEYVDLYLVHWPSGGQRRETWLAMEEIFASGRAKAIGVSNYTVRHLQEMLDYAEVIPAVNQVEFHPFIYDEQAELLGFCRQQGIVVEAYSPLAHGKRHTDPVLTSIAEKHGKTTAQVLLRWAIQHGTVPLPKSSHQERIRENLEIFDFELHSTEMQQMDGLGESFRTCWDPTHIE